MSTPRRNRTIAAVAQRDPGPAQRLRMIPVLLATLALILTGFAGGGMAWASEGDPGAVETPAPAAATRNAPAPAPEGELPPDADLPQSEPAPDPAGDAGEDQGGQTGSDDQDQPQPSGPEGTVPAPEAAPAAPSAPQKAETPAPAQAPMTRAPALQAGGDVCGKAADGSYSPCPPNGNFLDIIDSITLKTWDKAKNAWVPATALQTQSGFRVEGTWTAPDSAQPGDQFKLEFPKNDEGKYLAITSLTQKDQPLRDGTGRIVAFCDIGPRAYTCTFTDFVKDNVDVTGSFDIGLRAENDNGNQPMEWTSGSKTWKTIGVKYFKGTPSSAIPPNFGKSGYAQGNDWKNWHWTVNLTNDTSKGDKSVMKQLQDQKAAGNTLIDITDTMGDVSFFQEPQGVTFSRQGWKLDDKGAKVTDGDAQKWTMVDGQFPPDCPLQVVGGYDTSRIDEDGSRTGLVGAQLGIYTMTLDLSKMDLENDFFRFEFNSKMDKSVKDIGGVGMVNEFSMKTIADFDSKFTAPKNNQVAGGKSGSISWVKVDGGSTAKLLGGSEWEISGTTTNGDPVAAFKIVDNVNGTTVMKDQNPAAGRFRVASLAPGTYTLKETKAPEGYAVDGKEHPVTIPAVVDGKDVYDVSLGLIKNTSGAKVQFKKVDQTSGAPLAGATFAVTGVDGDGNALTPRPGTLTSDAEGMTGQLEVQQGATYTLTETTAPAGYALPANPSASFTVNAISPDLDIVWTDKDKTGPGALGIKPADGNPALGIISNEKAWTPIGKNILMHKDMIGSTIPDGREYTFNFDVKVIESPSGNPAADVKEQKAGSAAGLQGWKVEPNGEISGYDFDVTVKGAKDDEGKPTVVFDPKSGTTAMQNIAFSKVGKYTIEVTERQEGGQPGITSDTVKYLYHYEVGPDWQLVDSSTKVERVDTEGNVTPVSGSTAKFSNEYQPRKTSFRPTASKAISVTGTDPAKVSDEFTFTFDRDQSSPPHAVPEEFSPNPKDQAKRDITVTGATGSVDRVLLQMPRITFAEGGEYIYTVQEKEPSPKKLGWTYNTKPIKVTVDVGDDLIGGEATLWVRSVTYERDGKTYIQKWTLDTNTGKTTLTSAGSADDVQKVVNEYKPEPTEFQPKLSKTVTGPAAMAAAPEDAPTFDFAMTAANELAKTDAEIAGKALAGEEIAAQVTAADAWKQAKDVLFAQVKLTVAGEYKFRLQETTPKPVPAGWTYDSTPVDVTVTVVDKEGQLTVEKVAYDKGGEVTDKDAGAALSNDYTPQAVRFTPEVAKDLKVVGADAAPVDAFDFHLEADQDTASKTGQRIYNESDHDAHIDGLNAEPSKTTSFGEIEFTEPGTYTYEITEAYPGKADPGQGGGDVPQAGWTFDKATIKLTVTVEDEDGALKVANAEYSGGQGAAQNGLVNRYEAKPVEFTPQVSKSITVTGAAKATDQTFAFELSEGKGNPEQGATLGNTTAIVKGLVADKDTATEEFGAITFSKEGKYRFTIEEKQPDPLPAGWTYDVATTTLTVVVQDNGQGQLEIAGTNYMKGDVIGGGAAQFVNAYGPAPVPFVPEVRKGLTLIGATEAPAVDGGFTFAIAQQQLADKPGPVAVFASDEAKIARVAAVHAGETVKSEFGSMQFTEEGTYTFLITEQAPDPLPAGWTYDTSAVTLTVVVKDNGKGALEIASSTYSGGTDGALVNTYAAEPARLPVAITKNVSVTGADDAPDREFSFTMTADAKNPADGAKPAATTAKVSGVTKDAPKKAEFGEIIFEKAGAYAFAITEDKPDPIPAGWTYDSSTITLTVEVKDNGAGKLEAVGTYSGGEGDAGNVLVNQFKPEEPPGETPPPPTNPPKTTPPPRGTNPPKPVTKRTLPVTGAQVGGLAAAAVGMLGAGALLIGRNRRDKGDEGRHRA